MSLIEKIHNKTARLAVIGLGYVGLPLVVEFAKAGFNIMGIDVDKIKVEFVNLGKSYIGDVSDEDLKDMIDKEKLTATNDYEILKDVDMINMCVPTPLGKTKEPDISYIISATKEISKYLKKD